MKKELFAIVNSYVIMPPRLVLSQTFTQISCSRLFYIGYSFREFYLIRHFLSKCTYYYIDTYWDSEVLMTSRQITTMVFGRNPPLSLLASVLQ